MMTHDASHDFDFEQGDWRVRHRAITSRLTGCTEWEEFEGVCSARLILGGHGNIEDNLIHLPGGSYRAVALRSFNQATGAWAIWWLDGRSPHRLDVPVVGRFVDGLGTFLADDTLDGRPIRVRFHWGDTASESPRWEQAFSADGGATWETNWTMRFTRS